MAELLQLTNPIFIISYTGVFMSYISDPNYQTILRRRRSRRSRQRTIHKVLQVLLFLAIILVIGVGGFFVFKAIKNHQNSSGKPDQTVSGLPDSGNSENPDNIIIDGSGQDSAEPDLSLIHI